jgi:hypothetical protein
MGSVLKYDGTFTMSYLHDDEQIRSAGDGTGAIEITQDGERWQRVDIGDEIHRCPNHNVISVVKRYRPSVR